MRTLQGRSPAFWVALLLAALWPLFAHAQSNAALERQVKAAYLYKFAGFVEWPEGSFARPDSPVVIGVAGADALAEQLEQTVAGHSANGRPLQVRRIKRGDSLAGIHMLFISSLDKAHAQELLAASRGQPVLTVTDADETYGLGSMINFLIADERLRFEVSLKHAAVARLKISARMLSAAFRVQQVAG
ncbi:YfiR family protein [Pseudoduganella violaceinigra]|uniref:YfiR family protein n=1 Tax=Pseudoduganella violaceinigra TaxID=246602 RepID=UPI0013777586|nr:YfiR family protein [Pseudoduganella violaceinigra]